MQTHHDNQNVFKMINYVNERNSLSALSHFKFNLKFIDLCGFNDRPTVKMI